MLLFLTLRSLIKWRSLYSKWLDSIEIRIREDVEAKKKLMKSSYTV